MTPLIILFLRRADDEVQTLERLYDDKAYFKTLSRNQRYSLTRRIQEEYNVSLTTLLKNIKK